MAVWHLDGRAAIWYMRVEATEDSVQNIDELRRLMFKEFVPSIEKSQTNMSLVALQMNAKADVDNHIDNFEEPMEISENDMKGAYKYLFLILPDSFKVELTKCFEVEAPNDNHKAYRRVRTLRPTRTWTEQAGLKKPGPGNDNGKLLPEGGQDLGKSIGRKATQKSSKRIETK